MITDATSKVDRPSATGRRSEQADVSGKVPHAAGRQSGFDTAGTAPADRAVIEQAVGKVRDVLQKSDSRLQIEIDPDLQRVIVKVLAGDSGEIIRQIPPKEVLELAKNLSDQRGLLLTKRA